MRDISSLYTFKERNLLDCGVCVSFHGAADAAFFRERDVLKIFSKSRLATKIDTYFALAFSMVSFAFVTYFEVTLGEGLGREE